MRFGLREREVVIGATAGLTAYVVVKKGVGGMVPAIGPVTPPFALIIAGLFVSSFVDGGGLGGDIATGVGFGLIAAGAIAL